MPLSPEPAAMLSEVALVLVNSEPGWKTGLLRACRPWGPCGPCGPVMFWVLLQGIAQASST